MNQKQNKYNYLLVIQQLYANTWEDASEYAANSKGKPIEQSGQFSKVKICGRDFLIPISLYSHDLKEYKLMGYPTRTIFRKELNVTKLQTL